jgi:pilus assembly protein CpaC
MRHDMTIEANNMITASRAKALLRVLLGSMLLASVAALAAPPASQPAATPPTLVLNVNEQQTLPGTGGSLKRVAIGDPTVVDVLATHGQVLLYGIKPGTTQVLVWPSSASLPRRYTVEVRGALDGALLGAATPAVSVHGDHAVVSGSAQTLEAHQAAVAAASASVGSKNVVDASVMAGSAMVQVDVKVVEFSKNVLKDVGFNIFGSRSNGFGFGLFGPSTLNSVNRGTDGLSVDAKLPISSAFNLVLSHANGVLGTLSVLNSDGLSRTLAEPTLVAMSGQSASFLAGGELPIPEPQGLGTTTITYKPFGIGLTVTPTVLGPNRIALKVAPEASELDYTNGVTLNGVSVPGLITRRADTTVQLGDGESYVIGGLVSSKTASAVDKVPLLGDLPVIGAFFRSLKYSRDEKELVFIVTPHLVQPFAKGTELPLPGDGHTRPVETPWGSFLLGGASQDQLPGFSR